MKGKKTIALLCIPGCLVLLGVAGYVFYPRYPPRGLQGSHQAAISPFLRISIGAFRQDVGRVPDSFDELDRWLASTNRNVMPSLREVVRYPADRKDVWGRELRYKKTKSGCRLWSAGPDGWFWTPDDITAKAGK